MHADRHSHPPSGADTSAQGQVLSGMCNDRRIAAEFIGWEYFTFYRIKIN